MEEEYPSLIGNGVTRKKWNIFLRMVHGNSRERIFGKRVCTIC